MSCSAYIKTTLCKCYTAFDCNWKGTSYYSCEYSSTLSYSVCVANYNAFCISKTGAAYWDNTEDHSGCASGLHCGANGYCQWTIDTPSNSPPSYQPPSASSIPNNSSTNSSDNPNIAAIVVPIILILIVAITCFFFKRRNGYWFIWKRNQNNENVTLETSNFVHSVPVETSLPNKSQKALPTAPWYPLNTKHYTIDSIPNKFIDSDKGVSQNQNDQNMDMETANFIHSVSLETSFPNKSQKALPSAPWYPLNTNHVIIDSIPNKFTDSDKEVSRINHSLSVVVEPNLGVSSILPTNEYPLIDSSNTNNHSCQLPSGKARAVYQSILCESKADKGMSESIDNSKSVVIPVCDSDPNDNLFNSELIPFVNNSPENNSSPQHLEKSFRKMYSTGSRRPDSAVDVYKLPEYSSDKESTMSRSCSNQTLDQKNHVTLDLFETSEPDSVIHDRFILQEQKCYGGFSVIRLAIDNRSNKKVALKLTKNLDRYKNEVSMLKLLRHEHVIEILDFFEERNMGMIVLPWTPRILKDLISKSRFPELKIKIIAQEIGYALSWIHSKNIVHCDVKPGNILHDIVSDSWKLIDFDCATKVGNPAPFGTPCYVAPELAKAMLQNQRISTQISLDVWSFGVVLYEMLSGKCVVEGSRDDHDILKDLCSPDFQVDMSVVLNKFSRNVCVKFLQVNAQARISMNNFLRSTFISGGLDTVEQENHLGSISEKVHSMNRKVENIELMSRQIVQKLDILKSTLLGQSQYNVPRFFILLPANGDGFWKRVTRIGHQKFELHLLCEHDDCPHQTDHPGLPVLDPNPLLRVAGPLIALSATMIAAALCIHPVSGTVTKVASQVVASACAVGIQSLAMNSQSTNSMLGFGVRPTEYFETLTSIIDEMRGSKTKDMTIAELHEATGPALRELASFLNLNDPSRKYGGLYCCPVDGGNIRWLCKDHMKNKKF